MLNVLVVEDHALVRDGILITLRALGEGVATIDAADVKAAIDVLEKRKIDLMILDLMLPGMQGQTFIPVVRRRFSAVRVIVVSALDDAAIVARVMQAGVMAFVSKSGSGAELIDAVRAVLAGEHYFSPRLRQQVERRGVINGAARGEGISLVQCYGLTPAQARVLELLRDGSSNRHIAELLGVTEGTVKIHVSAIIKALGVTNRAEAALLVNRRRRAG